MFTGNNNTVCVLELLLLDRCHLFFKGLKEHSITGGIFLYINGFLHIEVISKDFCPQTLNMLCSLGYITKYTSIVFLHVFAKFSTASDMIWATSSLLKPKNLVPMAGNAIDWCCLVHAKSKHSDTALERIYNKSLQLAC